MVRAWCALVAVVALHCVCVAFCVCRQACAAAAGALAQTGCVFVGEELVTGSPEWNLVLARHTIPDIDLDRDGKLSLNEYRLTMQANLIQGWNVELQDEDGDGLLGIEEFKFERPLFPLLRLIYFHRLDTNSNGKLERTEFEFKTRVPDEFFTLNEDGTGWKFLLFKFDGRACVWFASRFTDGKQLAFDAWPSGQQHGSAIYVMDIAGGKPREVCQGMMPSNVERRQRLACTRTSPGNGPLANGPAMAKITSTSVKAGARSGRPMELASPSTSRIPSCRHMTWRLKKLERSSTPRPPGTSRSIGTWPGPPTASGSVSRL